MQKALLFIFICLFGISGYSAWTTISIKSCGKDSSMAKCYGPWFRTTGYMWPNETGHKYETNAAIESDWACVFPFSSAKPIVFKLPEGGITVLHYSENIEKDGAKSSKGPNKIITLPGPDRTCDEIFVAKETKPESGTVQSD